MLDKKEVKDIDLMSFLYACILLCLCLYVLRM